MPKITNENYNEVKNEFNEERMSFYAELGLMGGITMLRGKEYINHEGLQYLAKKQGVKSQRCRLITELCRPQDNFWVAEATVFDKDGNIYMDIADASPANVGKAIANACPRMASTRATNRCLRKVLTGPGVALTSAEEMPDAFDSSDPDLGGE